MYQATFLFNGGHGWSSLGRVFRHQVPVQSTERFVQDWTCTLSSFATRLVLCARLRAWLSAVRPAKPRFEAPVLGERLECRAPLHASALAGLTHRAGAVVEMLASVAAEVLGGALVRLEELAQPLIGKHAEEASARESERQHEPVLHHVALPKPHPGLSPIDLALLARRRLEACHGELRLRRQPAKRTHKGPHRLVAPGVATVPAQLLLQDPGPVVHRRRPGVMYGRTVLEQAHTSAIRIAAVFFVCASISAPTLGQSRPALTAPPPLELPSTRSRIFVPLSVSMSELQSAANAAVPESVNGRKNNPVGNPVKRDVLTWTAKRGRISVKNSNGRLAFRTDVRGRARIKGRIDLFLTQIPFSVHANLGAVLNASMRPRLRANWTFNPNVKANARVTYAEIPIEHIGSISIRSEVQPVLNRELAKALHQLRETVDNPNLLKHQLRPVWSQICTVIPVEGDVPNLWFVIKPQRLLASQLQVNNQGVKLALGLETQTSLLAQPRRPPQPHCPLPARLD